MNADNSVSFTISPKTKYILSTSGRISSLQRYQKLLQALLRIDVAYLPFHSGDEENAKIDPQRFVWALRGLPCIGGAISKDIKHGVVPFLDELDETARMVQSVNTIIVEERGRLVGYNTDVFGFRFAIENGIEKSKIPVRSAVCYGYGGVASVVVSVLQQLGITVHLCGRNLQTARDRAQHLSCEVWSSDISSIDLFVNATPASEYPLEEAENFLPAISSVTIAFDHEMPGKYMREYCEHRNIYYISGTEMYYPQMEMQWGLFLQDYLEPKDLPLLIAKANE